MLDNRQKFSLMFMYMLPSPDHIRTWQHICRRDHDDGQHAVYGRNGRSLDRTEDTARFHQYPPVHDDVFERP